MAYKFIFTISLFTLLIFSSKAFAIGFDITASTWPHALMGLLGGITFLLYGLDKMTASFKALAGRKLKYVLGKLTTNRLSSLLTGAGVTAIVQSSAATTVMVVGFISAKLMTLPQSLAVILGADIGTTLTVQLIAFKLNQYALVAIIFGFMIKNISRTETVWNVGRVFMAIGMIFFGIFLISESMGMLQTVPIVKQTMSSISNPLLGILLGFVITALMQSSAAALAIAIALADKELLSISAAFYLVLGCNVGTCITAILASLKSNQDGQRAAAAHAFFKISGALFFVIAYYLFQDILLGQIAALDGKTIQESLKATPREIAHMHTIFNITLAILFLPFINQVANRLTKLIKSKRRKWHLQAKYLDNYLLDTPGLALNAARIETAMISNRVRKILKLSFKAVAEGEIDDLNKLKQEERNIDALHNQVVYYLGQISTRNLTKDESLQLVWLMNSVNRLETISDLLGDELYQIGRKRRDLGYKIDKTSYNHLEKISNAVRNAFKHSVKGIVSFEVEIQKSDEAIHKESFKKLLDKSYKYHTKKLITKGSAELKDYSIEMDIADKYQRIFYHSRKVASDTNKLLHERKNKGKIETSDEGFIEKSLSTLS